ncbi:hypothetical protein AAG570_012889 [Ranatra chinensis]|uniref:Uncharacterized protein n=1 Tax=Ranatra chinensis TaxID=642074 RepID=A0ABD0YF55_9HEMI
MQLLSATVLIGAVIFLATSYVGADKEEVKLKRDASGLFPFPRVGRSRYPTLCSSFNPEDKIKREGLIPFPRVGRSGDKRDNTGSSGLWFGPRLGRVQKRNNPWLFVDGPVGEIGVTENSSEEEDELERVVSSESF